MFDLATPRWTELGLSPDSPGINGAMKWEKDKSQNDAHQPQHQTQEQQHPDSPGCSSIGEKAIDSPPFPLQVKSALLQLVAPRFLPSSIFRLPISVEDNPPQYPFHNQTVWYRTTLLCICTPVNLRHSTSLPSLLVDDHYPCWPLSR